MTAAEALRLVRRRLEDAVKSVQETVEDTAATLAGGDGSTGPAVAEGSGVPPGPVGGEA